MRRWHGGGDMVLRDARLMDVVERRIRTVDIAVRGGRFVRIGPPGDPLPKGLVEIDCAGRYVSPGLIDAHTHTELSLMTVAPFSEMVTPCGTTSAIIDCHDFVNVLGMRALDILVKEARKARLRAFFMVPSCVPSASGFEDAGASVTAMDVARALELPGVIGLAEVMDIPRLFRREQGLMDIIGVAKGRGMIIDGHAPALGEDGERVYFKLSGAVTDHESTTVAEIIRKLKLGVRVHLRRTSLGREYPYRRLFSSRLRDGLMLSTDGVISPLDVRRHGHINAFVREVIADGVDPVEAVRAASFNTAVTYGLDSEIGSVSEGLRADFLILKNLRGFTPERVFIGGVEVNGQGHAQRRSAWPGYALDTVRVRVPARGEISVRAPARFLKRKTVMANVIMIRPGSLITGRKRVALVNHGGELHADAGRDILKAVVMERFSGKGRPVIGFVKGFGLRRGALGGTIGQDSQHLVVVGADDDDILSVIKEAGAGRGGIFLSTGGRVRQSVSLPIAGIATDANPAELSTELAGLERAIRACGAEMKSPYLTLSLCITLAAIPELKMTNRGLFDVMGKRFIDTVIDEGAS